MVKSLVFPVFLCLVVEKFVQLLGRACRWTAPEYSLLVDSSHATGCTQLIDAAICLQHFLAAEKQTPASVGYDRPSHKFLQFIRKHYGEQP